MFNSSKTAGGRAIIPASYDLHSVLLTMNDNSTIEIKSLVADIIINESLFKQSIETNIKIVDAFDLFQKSHLSGGEKIEIKIKRIDNGNESYSKSKNKFDITCYIADISDHVKPKEGIQYYNISCLSEHAFINAMKSVNRAFSGNINALVRDICKNDLNVEKAVFADKNLPVIKGIYPNLKPLDAVTWLLRNSSDQDTPFFFYETINDGLQFNSYKELLAQDNYKTYNNTSYYVNEYETPEYFDEAGAKILSMSSDLNMSKYHQISDGAFASTTHCVDISNKNYNAVNFDKTTKNNERLNMYESFSKKIKFNDQKFTESYDAKDFFISVNSSSFDGTDNYHASIKDSISNKNSYFQSIRFMGLDLELYGDFKLSPGKLISLKIPKSTDANILKSEGRDGMVDQLLSGNYIVSSIAHVFDGNEYKCDIGIQKDSLTYDLDSKIIIGAD